MKKQTGINPELATAAENFLAANTPAPRLDGRPHKKAPVKKGRRSKKSSRRGGSKAKKVVAAKPRQRAASNPAIPAIGSKIERIYKKEKFVIEVVEGGFKLKGKTYPSLTATAMAITGYKAISGPVFFRLVETKRPAAKKES